MDSDSEEELSKDEQIRELQETIKEFQSRIQRMQNLLQIYYSKQFCNCIELQEIQEPIEEPTQESKPDSKVKKTRRKKVTPVV